MKLTLLIISIYCLLQLTNAHSEEMIINPELDTLLQVIESKRIELNIPAIGLTLVNKDKTIFSGSFGIADKTSAKEVDEHTVFRIGSTTKSFTALAVLILVDDGKLNLDDRLFDIAPELKINNKWQDTHPILISHLLEHTAGLTDLSGEEFNFNEPLSLDEALKRNVDSRVIQWPPGMHHSYTNIGAGLLAYVIEKCSGMSYEDFVQDRIFNPLKMSSASFYPDEKTLKHLATGYDKDGVSPIPYWQMTFRAFGAINIKPTDMASFLQLMLNKGTYKNKRIVSESLLNNMHTPATTLAAKSGLKFGYGSGSYTFFRNGHVFYGHGGDGDGYLARYGVNPESGMAYFVVINVFRDSDLVEVRRLIEDFITKNLKPVEYPSAKLSQDQLQQYTGQYKSVTWRFPVAAGTQDHQSDIKVVIQNNKLTALVGENVWQLIPVSAQHFRFKNESKATMAFIRTQEGQLFLQSELGNFIKIN
jgi:CubicO group peptidase (beta-lactamase class C family)